MAIATGRYGVVRAGWSAPAPRGERRIVRVLGPDAAAHRTKQPCDVAARGGKFYQLSGVGCFANNGALATGTILDRAECLPALQRVGGCGASVQTSPVLRASNVPGTQLPRRRH